MSLVKVTCPCGVACEAMRTGDVSRPITASATTNIAEMAVRPEVCFALIVTTPFELAPKTSVRIFQTRRGGGGVHPSCNPAEIYHHQSPPRQRNIGTLAPNFADVHGGNAALLHGVSQRLSRASWRRARVRAIVMCCTDCLQT